MVLPTQLLICATDVPTSAPSAAPIGDKRATTYIILMYMSFWLFFLIGALSKEYQQGKKLEHEKRKMVLDEEEVQARTKKMRKKMKADFETSGDPRDIIKDLLKVTLARIFTGVFGNDSAIVNKLWYEFEHEHLYASLFLSRKVGAKRWMYACKLLSSLCLAAVLLSVMLDLHVPANSGQCEGRSSSGECYELTLHFDPYRNQCEWSETAGTCSYDYTNKRFGYRGFLVILMVVVITMGGCMLALDAIFESILRAPAISDTKDVSQDIERDTLRLQYHKKVHAQLNRLNKGIIDYRELLLAKSQTEDLEEFDAQWGVHLAKDGSEELVWMDKIAFDLYDVVKQSHEVRVLLRKKGEIQCGTHMIYLFALDLMGRASPAGRIFANKTEDGVKLAKPPISSALKVFCFISLLLGDILCCYYNCVLVRGRESNYVFFFVVLFMTYMLTDFFFVEASKVFWVDFLFPLMVAPNAHHAEMVIHDTLNKIINDVDREGKEDLEKKRREAMIKADAAFGSELAKTGHDDLAQEEEGQPKPELPSETLPDPTFSTSDHLYVSTRVAKHFPGLFESAIILSYNEPLPFATALYWGQHVSRPKHTYRRVKPTADVGIDGNGNGPAVNKGRIDIDLNPNHKESPEDAAEYMYKQSIQNLIQQRQPSDSTLQWLYRTIVWACLEFAGVAPIEVQKFVIHVIQPCLIFAIINVAYQIREHTATGIYIVAVVMVLAFIILLLYMSHERALREEDHDVQHGVHTHDESDEEEEFSESDSEEPDLEAGGAVSEIRSPAKVKRAKDILSTTLRRDETAKASRMMQTAVTSISKEIKKGEKGFNLRAAVNAASSAANAPKATISVKFAPPQASTLEMQLESAEKQEMDAAMTAITKQNEAVKAREEETIAKERERQKQTELMNRILKGGPRSKDSLVDQEDSYAPDRSAEKKINARLDRMSEGKSPFNSAYSSKGLPPKSSLGSPIGRAAEPPRTLASLISSHKITPSPTPKKGTPGSDVPIVYPSGGKK